MLAPVVLGLAWLEDLYDRSRAATGPSSWPRLPPLAACVTPLGPAVWAYAVALSANPEVTARISEWQPTNIRTVAGLLFFGSAALVVPLIARRGRIVAWPTLAWLATFCAARALRRTGRRVVAAGPRLPALAGRSRLPPIASASSRR